MLPGLVAPAGFIGAGAGYLGSTSAEAYSTTTLTINKPAGVVSGDILVAFMSNSGTARTWTGDTGWTEAIDQGASPSLRTAYKVLDGSEGSSFTFTASGSTNSVGCILAYRGLAWDTIGASVSTRSGDGALAITGITAAGGILIAAVASAEFVVVPTISTPTGMTLLATKTHSVSNNMISVFDQSVSPGSTGTRSSTIGGGTTYTAGGVLGALK